MSDSNSDLDLDLDSEGGDALPSTSYSSRSRTTILQDLENHRNVRARTDSGIFRANDGEGIYIRKTELLIDNISITRSNTPGVSLRRPFNPTSSLISLSDLVNNGSKYGTNLVLIILSISAVSTNNLTMYQQKSNGIRGGSNTVRHDRNMVVMCPLSPSGNNTAMILFGAGCCERFFDGDISLRDNGEIRTYKTYLLNNYIFSLTNSYLINFLTGPGATILLANPQGTDKFVSNGSTPILVPQRPAVVINKNFHLPLRHIVTEGTDMNGFILNDCEITPMSFHVRNTRCGGNLCDRQKDDVSKCACYQMPNRSGNVIISVEVLVCLPDGNTFKTYLRSKWFLEKYILSGSLPAGVRANSFEDWEIEDCFFTSLDKILKYINGNKKFQVVGWAKRGEIMDQGVSQPNNGLHGTAAKVMVQSGTLNHHITRLEPMDPTVLNSDHYDTLRFNVDTGFNIQP